MERPYFLSDAHLGVLADLDEAALSNMFLAVPYMLRRFPELSPRQAQDAVLYWLNAAETELLQEVLIAQ